MVYGWYDERPKRYPRVERTHVTRYHENHMHHHSAPSSRDIVAGPPTIVTTEGGDKILNVGKDNEIPREYARYVSQRSIGQLRQRHKMCNEARPGYCSAPNVPHCHGSYCHAHTGGDQKHTH